MKKERKKSLIAGMAIIGVVSTLVLDWRGALRYWAIFIGIITFLGLVFLFWYWFLRWINRDD